MCFRYINETLNREREPTQVTPLVSSIGSLFSGTYSMSPPPQSPSFSPSRSVSPSLHIPSSVTLNSPPLSHRRVHSPQLSSADPHEHPSLSQPQVSYHTESATPYSSQGGNYQRSTSVPRGNGFSSGPSQLSASSTYSGSETRARPDGTPLHQSSRSYDSSYSFNPTTASTSRYPGSYTYSSPDSQYHNGGRGLDSSGC